MAQGKTLEEIEESLQLTQSERNQLNTDLSSTKDLVASLQESLAGLKNEKSTLETAAKQVAEKEAPKTALATLSPPKASAPPAVSEPSSAADVAEVDL